MTWNGALATSRSRAKQAKTAAAQADTDLGEPGGMASRSAS